MPWMLFLLATTLSQAAHSWQTLQHKEGSPSSAPRAPRHLQSACSTPPMPPCTQCAHTKFLQIFPSANWAPKCTFTVQAESRAIGDKGNTVPILWSPIQYTGLERLQTVRDSLPQRPSPGWPGWELAPHRDSGSAPHNGLTSRRHPASHTLSFLSSLAQPCPQSALVNTASILCWQSIFFPSLSHSKLPEQRPRRSSWQGQEHQYFL